MKKKNRKLKLIHSKEKDEKEKIRKIELELKTIIEKIEKNINQKIKTNEIKKKSDK